VEALELAERLRMRGRGVDQLDAALGQLALERDLDAEEAAGATIPGESDKAWYSQ